MARRKIRSKKQSSGKVSTFVIADTTKGISPDMYFKDSAPMSTYYQGNGYHSDALEAVNEVLRDAEKDLGITSGAIDFDNVSEITFEDKNGNEIEEPTSDSTWSVTLYSRRYEKRYSLSGAVNDYPNGWQAGGELNVVEVA